MKRTIISMMLVICFVLLLAACGGGNGNNPDENNGQENNVQSENVNNNENNEVKEATKETEGRLVATTVAITEIMDELELDLVGVPTSYKDLPERYADATDIGNPMGPDMEVVLSLKPTEVFSVTTLLSDLEASFAQYDVPVHFVDLTSVEAMFNEITAIGEKYDRVEEAEQLIAKKESKIEEIANKTDGLDKPKVLVLMGIPGSYIVGTEHSYIGDLVERAGGVNAVEGRDEEYISANTEYLQQLNPDVILRAAHGAPEEVVKMFDLEFKENDIWKHFTAVQNDRVFDLEETLFGTTANLAVDEALEDLVDMLHE